MENKKTYIYTLSCPKTGDIKYVGKSNNPILRFRKHLQRSDNNKLKNDWISMLISDNQKPILNIIEEVNLYDWKDKEKFYISKYRNLGYELFNSSCGGDGLTFGNKTSFNGSNSVRVVCLNTDGTLNKIFYSAKEAAKSINKHNISSALKGVTKKAGGYIWLYESIYISLSVEEINNLINEKNSKSNNKSKTIFKKGVSSWNSGMKGLKLKPNKNVHQFDIYGNFIKTWETSKIASISITGNEKGEHNISRCARGENNTAFNYKWSYEI